VGKKEKGGGKRKKKKRLKEIESADKIHQLASRRDGVELRWEIRE